MRVLCLAFSACFLVHPSLAQDPWVAYDGAPEGGGAGKRIVLLAGDEEYRSEEGLPMLGRILARRHGFDCVVLFSQDADGFIDPNASTNVPGMHLLEGADLVVVQFRFRRLPDDDMKRFVDYMRGGGPILALRTSTHAFNYPSDSSSSYARFGYNSREWPGGFGQQVLGDTWVSHHGRHGAESTRGLIDGSNARHPVLRGVRDVWGPTDVYRIDRLGPGDAVLLHGLTLSGMTADAPSNYDKALMPIAWTRDYAWDDGSVTRSLTSTIGAAEDLESEGLRRLLVNACYWLTGLEPPRRADVNYVGEYDPSPFGFDKFNKGVRPSDHQIAR